MFVVFGPPLTTNTANRRPHDYEQLMIIYFDVLLIDNESLLPVRQSERRERLAQLVTCISGRSDLVACETIHFSRNTAPAQLREAFAAAIVGRKEGLVLKPDEPYFDFSTHSKPHTNGNIKLKKEYVQGWGDVGDFAVIGASYDAVKAKSYPSHPPRWTHFFIACLQNKIQVLAKNENPRFRHVNVVELNNNLMDTFQKQCRPVEISPDDNIIFEMDTRNSGESTKPTVLFAEPLVFDIRCFSFDKSPNSGFWSMRFPMVSKIHFDRSFLDTMTFEDLQAAAIENTTMAEQEDSQELRRWISGLEKADPQGVAIDAASSQGTFSEAYLTPSPIRRKQPRMGQSLGAITEGKTRALTSDICLSSAHAGQLSMASPRSSVIEVTESNLQLVDVQDENSPPSRKHTAVDTPTAGPHKKPCRQGWTSSHRRQSKSSHGRLDQSEVDSQGRPPLSEVQLNWSSSDHRISQALRNSTASSRSVQAKISQPDSPTRRPVSDNPTNLQPQSCSETQPSKYTQASSGVAESLRQVMTCPHSGTSCVLARRFILLAPCISSYALVTETLLGAHGISHWATHPTQWQSAEGDKDRSCLRVAPTSYDLSVVGNDDLANADASLCLDSSHLQSSPAVGAGPSPPRLRGPRTRKICFVESRRKEATAAFLKVIEQADLRRGQRRKQLSKIPPGGVSPRKGIDTAKRKGKQEREWVAVYDWRVLEVLTDIETGKIPVPKDDPWRRFWVGLA